MGKLLELLNEYASTFSVEKWTERDVDDYPNPTIICSKKYGFIKRLVDNDKIRKSYKEGLPTITKNGFLLEGNTTLLMLLAISDTPIDDLISYLK